MTTIKVWPTKASAVDLKHPNAPKLALEGALWPQDSFTARRLRDGAATTEAGKVYVPPKDSDVAVGADVQASGLVVESAPPLGKSDAAAKA